jgi:hypothetical protein
MTRPFRHTAALLGYCVLVAALGACHEHGEPDHPGPTSPIFPVLSGDAGPGAAPDAASDGGGVPAGGPGASVDAGGGAPAAAPNELPCEIASFLKQRCISCHGAPPLPGVPMALATRADLNAPARSNPALNNAQLAQQRVQSGTMPPGGGLSAAEIQLFGAWVQAGAQPGSCTASADAGPVASADAAIGLDAAALLDAAQPEAGASAEAGAHDAAVSDAGQGDAAPSDAGSACSSGRSWTGGTRGSALMNPGSACVACHASSGRPLSFGGSLYASAHEPDDCEGALGNGVSVLIKGADGRKLTLTPNAVGNFFSQITLSAPYTVEIHYQGRVRSKLQPQSDGDCNACHSEHGAGGAAGRLMLP